MQWLVVKVGSTETDSPEFAVIGSGDEKIPFQRASWEKIADLAARKKLLLLIPTEDVLLTRLHIPTRNAKQRLKALPFAIEEYLAESVDQVHIANHYDKDSEDTLTATVNRERLSHWLATPRDFGLRITAVLPDVFALPVNSFKIKANRVSLRSNVFNGLVSQSQFSSQILEEWYAQHQEDTKLLINQRAEDLPSTADTLPVKFEAELSNYCYSDLLSALPLNLLNGFREEGQATHWAEQLQHWRLVASLLLVCGLVWTGMNYFTNWQLQRDVERLDTQIATVFQETFPGQRVDSDYRILRATMAEKLQSIQSPGIDKRQSVLEILALIAPELKQQKDVSLKQLNYVGDGYELAVTTSSLSSLESFRSKLDKGRLKTEMKTSSSSSDKVDAVMVVKWGGGQG